MNNENSESKTPLDIEILDTIMEFEHRIALLKGESLAGCGCIICIKQMQRKLKNEQNKKAD